MSKGEGGSARIVLQNESTVVYEYAPYNLDELGCKNENLIYDGLITISKDALTEPEIYEKLKRMPNGRKKLIVKRVRKDVDYGALLNSGKIVVVNSKYCWRFVGMGKDVGMMAMKIIFKVYDSYQDEGVLPEKVSIFY